MEVLEEGNCAMNNGDYETAIKNYNNCVEVADENSLKTIAYFGLGNAYTLSNKRQQAINSFNHCLKFSSKVESEYFEHQVYLGLGSVHSNIKRLEDAMKKDEMEFLCHIALGGLNKSLGNYEQSFDHYRKGFSLIESQQQQHEQHHRPQRPRKVGGINVSKDFVNLNMKNLSIVTSAGIVSGVLAVLWELAELFNKLEQYREAADIYEMYLEIVTEDEDIEKQKNVMERLVQIYEEEERYYLRDSMEDKLQEIIKKKNEKELLLQEWKFNDPSIKHQELFLKMIKYGQDPNVKVQLLNDVRVIFSDEFCIGKGSDGTRVYLGLSKDGCGKAVKRILQYNFIDFAKEQVKIFNKIEKKKSNYVVNYSYFKKDTETEWVYLILDLCEESLEDFVHSSTLENLQNSLPKILTHILLGLVDLHRKPSPILHRNLKPSNVLRHAKEKFLIADFGLSRIMENGLTTHASNGDRGSPYWIAPESYCKDNGKFDKSSYKRESDVMNAGLVAYYVATKGKHPFGSEECRLLNLLRGNPVGLKEIKDVQLKHLLSWMLQLNPKLRPSANEALKHPYLLSDEEKFDMLCDLCNQTVIKIYRLLHHPNSDVHKQLNRQRSWKDCIDPEVFKLFKKRHYDSTWFGCVEFLLNFHQHRHDKPPTQLLQSNGNYEEYFVHVFPELPLLVHCTMRLTEEKSIPDLEEHLTNIQLQEWKHIDESTKHKKLLLKLISCGQHPDNKVENVNNVRVIFSDEFCIGKGNDGTRVYVGLGKDGYGKAVKRVRRDSCIKIAENEKKILNEGNAKYSQYVVNYSYYEERLGTEYVYLILDLCEESLKEYVESNSNSCFYYPHKLLPKILKQILKGLADLHRGPRPILHRDLKPSNVLRNAQGIFQIADFGLSRIMENSHTTHKSDANRGTQYWIAPESYIVDKNSWGEARYKRESDVMNAGMVAYYVATKGKHPFGPPEYRLKNLLDGNPIGLMEIDDVVLKDLLSWMLQHSPEDRPSAEKALKHPYLQSDKEKFSMLCDMGNQPEMKQSQGQISPNSDVVAQLYAPMEWMTRIDDEVLKDFTSFKKNGKDITLTYEPTWAKCLRFIRNLNQHWNDKHRAHLLRYVKDGNYVDYFLQRFPELPLLVHKIMRSTDWKTRPDLKRHFTNEKSKELSKITRESFGRLLKEGKTTKKTPKRPFSYPSKDYEEKVPAALEKLHLTYQSDVNVSNVDDALNSKNDSQRLSINQLNYETYRELCSKLNDELYGKDWKTLAGKMNYTAGEGRDFSRELNPADALLQHWKTTGNEHDVPALMKLLKEMGRYDLVDLLESYQVYNQNTFTSITTLLKGQKDDRREKLIALLNFREDSPIAFFAFEEKKSLLYLLNDNDSDADIGITSTSGPNHNNSEVIIGVSPSTSKPVLDSQRLSIDQSNCEIYRQLCNKLDDELYRKDWKTLAGKMNFTAGEVRDFSREKSPADALLQHWKTTSINHDVSALMKLLKEMERNDLVDLLESDPAHNQ
ncbi:uncharacterized protein LOC124437959 isoform X2 [Xenia sp. Carnegie-2017]|uniref:uncharacterized protein LOC124437959 isoform X2 n=1 Tax=Xenia sp. Carnegie-2017 TaxID=2897299 RepID=UPI001F036D7D|nr:uncharacterized protein LOC124437959 isoform X2 [Xenia sp. Carnegie-2017]